MPTPFDFDAIAASAASPSTASPSPQPGRPDEDDDDEREEKPQRDEDKSPGGPTIYEKALLDSRTLLISGPVDDKMLREATVRVLAMEQKDSKKPILVFINSPGGSADAGFAIYDLLRFIKPPVVTVVNGLCASAGILIHLAADKKRRFCLPESRFMIHQPSTMGRGTASDLDITAKEILKLRDRYNRIIAETCGKTVEQVTESARRDFWLDAGQALEYGLIAKVVRKRDELPE
jgi:ATP-dependent Clp protease protease subunit